MKAMLFVGLFTLSNFLYFELKGQQKPGLSGSTWTDVLENGQGEVTFYWYRSNPFIYEEKGNIKGIEYDIANRFLQFIEDEYDVSITTSWVEALRFEDLIKDISTAEGAIFGMSGVSVTDSRKDIVKFTPPYMHDISVLVSSPNVPVEYTANGFIKSLQHLTALTIKESIFEQSLLSIQKEHDIQFDFKHINRNSELIEILENSEDAIGYLDLPTFLAELDNGTSVRRQFFYPLKLPGLSFIYPKNSDWDEPVEAYFSSAQFQIDKHVIVTKYLGKDIIDLMEQIGRSAELGPEEEIIILTKERELQYKELLNQTRKMQQDQKLINLMILLTIVVLLIAAIFYTRYRVKASANSVLAAKQAEIEAKNLQLTELNDEKDRLIGVLAHDLRAPIGRMLGTTRIIMHDVKDEKKSEMLKLMVKEAERLNALITKILDVEAIENHRLNLNLEEVDVIPIVNELISDYQSSASRKEIKLITQLSHNRVYLKPIRYTCIKCLKTYFPMLSSFLIKEHQ